MAKEKNIGWVEIDEVENEKMKKVVQKEKPEEEEKSSKSNQSKKQKKEADENYTAEQIKILKDLEAVRKRPAMYIGSTGSQGLHHLIWEIVDNSVDEALAGYCDKIQVRILEDGSCEVEDNGRGVPIDIHPETGTPALEVVFTKLHAGGKFEKGVYKVSGGLHGVGASVVNALSEKLEVWVKRDGKYVYQKFSRGKPLGGMKILKESGVDETGTRVRFKPDPQIFETTEFSYEIVRNRLKEISYIIPKIKITITDKRTDQKDSFQSDEGLEGFVKELSQNSNVLFKKPIVVSGEKEDVKLESAMIYREEAEEIFYSFVNTIRTIDGGTHETGFKSALTKALNQFAPKVLKKDISFSGEDIRDGLVCAISIFIPDPQFEGQTKSKLGNTKVKNIVESISYDALTKFFEENPKIVEAIIKRVWQTHLEKEAEKKAKELVRKKAKEEIVLPGKLADCQERDPERTELFLVEGESAGGSAKQARDRKFQAILPLKGKILNVEKASILKMLKHEEIQAIISAIGCGIGKECKPENSRYNKIIILSDADIDGSHIRTLILTFLWRYMGALIEAGKVYIAQPPLYRVREKNQDVYIKDDQELREYIIRRGIRKLGLDESLVKSVLKGDMNGLKGVNISTVEEKGKDGITIQRFKGLGEMTPEQLWTTTLNPSTRVLKVVTVKDAQKAEELFQTLMGEKVEPRREFIIKNALSATTLDI
ncbi:MAG: DNA topoisomerase (ATP-hydrolyzing) subunit B [Candidatus Calescibacterium sp.]|nr:DNA topoisomerase (ATP-hydrolyzing) subunit B [Candidatus Calescibacterium sp.]MCX7734540.1 DNA topoisomerase (ATP-hydrolyzing) subunit B [bacterium]MDW8087636.1 DNA topoisomerase (ATP-hydrolyzing) subunit B [Candidatus Calescibacterium sp.]